MNEVKSDVELPRTEKASSLSWIFWAVLGAIVGLAFYVVVGLLLLREVLGGMLAKDDTLPWICRVLSDPINAMTLAAFGSAIAILLFRLRSLRSQPEHLEVALLTQDSDTLLLQEDTSEIRVALKALLQANSNSWLARIASSGAERARSVWSPTDVSSAIDSQSEIIAGELDAEYSIVRYFAWAIPSIGFIGTVLGIGQAMGTVGGGDSENAEGANSGMAEAAAYLNTAFDTTFVALFLSLILMFAIHVIQAKEEKHLLRCVEKVMHSLVNRMHVSTRTIGS